MQYQNNKKKCKQKQQILNDINSLEDIDLSKLVKSKRKKQEVSKSKESKVVEAEAHPKKKKSKSKKGSIMEYINN